VQYNKWYYPALFGQALHAAESERERERERERESEGGGEGERGTKRQVRPPGRFIEGARLKTLSACRFHLRSALICTDLHYGFARSSRQTKICISPLQ